MLCTCVVGGGRFHSDLSRGDDTFVCFTCSPVVFLGFDREGVSLGALSINRRTNALISTHKVTLHLVTAVLVVFYV